jgi:hypothetical protein
MHPVRRAIRAARSGCQTPEDDTTLAALGHVVAAYGAERLTGAGQRRAADRALRSVARRLAAEARAQDPVRAERLVIALRRAWRDLPAVERLPGDPRRVLWDRLVLLCCEEFYAPTRAAAASVRTVPTAPLDATALT